MGTKKPLSIDCDRIDVVTKSPLASFLEAFFIEPLSHEDAHTEKPISKVGWFTTEKDPHARTECHHR